jgi:hypothetical protein
MDSNRRKGEIDTGQKETEASHWLLSEKLKIFVKPLPPFDIWKLFEQMGISLFLQTDQILKYSTV